jgi:hypothetical protein
MPVVMIRSPPRRYGARQHATSSQLAFRASPYGDHALGTGASRHTLAFADTKTGRSDVVCKHLGLPRQGSFCSWSPLERHSRESRPTVCRLLSRVADQGLYQLAWAQPQASPATATTGRQGAYRYLGYMITNSFFSAKGLVMMFALNTRVPTIQRS